MKKVKVGISFLLLVLLSFLTGQVVLITNYFFALTFHELAHLIVAIKNGYTLKLIRLDILGLSIELNERIDDKDSFKINIAGPVFNLFLCVICMALYWLIPTSYIYLNTFCFCNLILALFNLLPVYPLDGGKIFRGLVKSDKVYKILDSVIRYSFAILFICAFVVSCFKTLNVIYIIMAIFFISNKSERPPTMSIFKRRQNKHFDKVVILKVEENEKLFNLIKQIKSYHYTIFYIPKLNKYLDEDELVDLSIKNSLNTAINELK